MQPAAVKSCFLEGGRVMGVSFRDKAFDIFRFFCENCRCKTVHGKREGIFGESPNLGILPTFAKLAVPFGCQESLRCVLPPCIWGREQSLCSTSHGWSQLHRQIVSSERELVWRNWHSGCDNWNILKRILTPKRPEENTSDSVWTMAHTGLKYRL